MDQEILYRQPGRGTFLTEHSRQRAKRRGLLACIVPYIRNAFAASVIAGAQWAAQRANYGLVLLNSLGQAELEEELLLESLGSVNGVLLLPVVRTSLPSVLEELMQRRYPLAFADRLPDHPNINSHAIGASLPSLPWTPGDQLKDLLPGTELVPGLFLVAPGLEGEYRLIH